MSDSNLSFGKKNLSISKLAIATIFIFWWIYFFNSKMWKVDQIQFDIVSYYAYLPAEFIHHDITLEFIRKDYEPFRYQFWPETTPTGMYTIKTTMGLSYLYAPFFFVANFLAPHLGYEASGFSVPYHTALAISAFAFLILGLVYFRKLLLLFFDDKTTALTILGMYFGSNWLWYTIGEPCMSHGYLFSLTLILLYNIVKWYERAEYLRSMLIGFLFGLIILIRPTMILFLIPFFLYDLKGYKFFGERIKLLWERKFHLIAMIAIAFLVGLPQLIYWHKVSGHWLYFSYTGERFFWNRPHIIEGMIGFRKGWLLYSPVMVLSVIGLFLMKGKEKVFKYGTILTFAITCYVIWSWWAWWYGGSFGQRAMIDIYALLAIPFAASVEFLRKNYRRYLLAIPAVGFLFTLGLFQCWQYKKRLIHYDSNSRRSYSINFLRTEHGPGWWDSLVEIDYEAAKAGLPSDRSKGKQKYEIDIAKFQHKDFPFQRTVFLSATNPYTHPVIIPYSDLKAMNVDSIYINAKMFFPESGGGDDIISAFSFRNDTAEAFSLSPNFKKYTYFENLKWIPVQTGIQFNDTLFRNANQLKIFVWDMTNKDIYVKDYTISYTKK